MPTPVQAPGVERWKGPCPSRGVEAWLREGGRWLQTNLVKAPEREFLDGDIFAVI